MTYDASHIDEPQPGQALVLVEEEPISQQDLLLWLGFDAVAIRHAASRSALHGSPLETELISLGYITEDAFYERLAERMDLAFWPSLDQEAIIDQPEVDVLLVSPHSVRLEQETAAPLTAIAPTLERLPLILDWIAESSTVRSRLVVTTPSAIRDAIWRVGSGRRVRDATTRLFDLQPHLSSRQTLTGSQGIWIGAAISALIVLGIQRPNVILDITHLALSLLYLGTVMLRLVSMPSAGQLRRPTDIDMLASPLPVYTILVALYREAPVLPQLVRSLGRIDWPVSRLDIKLVCEADDSETLTALAPMALPAHFEVVRVPPEGPRTKPKALNYALAGARGDFVTIYDAEDRPHPLQLREAHRRFLAGGEKLGCLQAPLVVSNGGDSWISTLFALEYAALFRCLLRMLAKHRLPMPLGGTSNHFPRKLLQEAGGWDPFNVTEDADLGLRLTRLGYRAEMLSCPTLEEAPVETRVWVAQRSRWFKGWLQTALVSLRHPWQLLRELGPIGLSVYLFTTVGMLASALFHPLLLVLIAKAGWRVYQDTMPVLVSLESFFLMIDGFNLVAGYGYFLVAGASVMAPRERRSPLWHFALIPAYWFLLSYAAWRAVLEIRHSPFLWHKTPHTPVKEPS